MAPRKSSKSKKKQQEPQEPEVGEQSNPTGIPDFDEVEFASWEQHDNFHKLYNKPFRPTRFLCYRTMAKMGITEPLKELCARTGTSAIFAMCEHSYLKPTIEFLSGFYYDRINFLVSFRLFNKRYEMPLSQFGDYFDMPWVEGMVNRVPNGFNPVRLWGRIARGARYDSSKLRIHDVSHPVLRMWLRLLTGTIFARHEPGNTGHTELAVLDSFLNIQRTERYTLHLAHFFALHLHNMAHQNKRSVNVGGLVTYLARKLNVLDDDRADRDDEPGVNFLHAEYLHHYIRIGIGGSYTWLLRGGEIPLPIRRLPPLIALPQAREGEVHEPTYYTVAPTEPPSSHSFDQEHLHEDEPPVAQPARSHSARAPTPPLHDSPAHTFPFQDPPEHTQELGSNHSQAYSHTQVLGSGSHSRARTIPLDDADEAAYPPFTHAPTPPVGGDGLPPLPSAREQYLHHNLTMYGLHASMVHQGFIPRTGPHPPYYTDPYATDGGYPGTLFETAGVDRWDYEAIYGHGWVDRRNVPGGGTSTRDESNIGVGESQGGSRRSQRARNRRGNGNE